MKRLAKLIGIVALALSVFALLSGEGTMFTNLIGIVFGFSLAIL